MNNTFIGEDIDRVYYDALEVLINRPDYKTKPRGIKIHETINTTLQINNPRKRIVTYKHRNISLRYLAGELAFYLSGSRKLKFISHYSKFWNKISDNGRTVNSCYGYKLFKKKSHGLSQFEYAREQLYTDTDTRRAVMIIYTSENTKLESHDNPCTMYLQFFIRDWQLILHVYMRSNDIWFGVPYDIPFFTIVQELLLVSLQIMNYEKFEGLVLGPYYHHTGSLHLYERDFKKAEKLLEEPIGFFSEWLNGMVGQDGEMPPITIDTVEHLNAFLKFEKDFRNNRDWGFYCEDEFLETLSCYLCSEDEE